MFLCMNFHQQTKKKSPGTNGEEEKWKRVQDMGTIELNRDRRGQQTQ